jgi:hypothetical protein
METNSLQGSSIYDMNEYDSNEFIDIQVKTDSIQEIQVNDVFESLKSQVDLYFHDNNLQMKELLVIQKNTFDCKSCLLFLLYCDSYYYYYCKLLSCYKNHIIFYV